jgi:hypothetical protein
MLIWDVYPDVLKITGMNEKNLVYKMWARLNYLSFKKAYKLFTIGNKMGDLLQKYVRKDKIIITPIWSIFGDNENRGKSEQSFCNSKIN